jgi:cupin fold WbuC family metalloprotein
MMQEYSIPIISTTQIEHGYKAATESPRRRFPLILHKQGADFNQVFNFMLADSYMAPHYHPSDEKTEFIHLVEGNVTVIYFDNLGTVKNLIKLEESTNKCVKVPPYTWHTYVILSRNALTYETMFGKYDPSTWKAVANWAPDESSDSARDYLNSLKNIVRTA